jgi:murein DD-endopeptidase MepM/ murein hydrolase activator NlpD
MRRWLTLACAALGVVLLLLALPDRGRDDALGPVPAPPATPAPSAPPRAQAPAAPDAAGPRPPRAAPPAPAPTVHARLRIPVDGVTPQMLQDTYRQPRGSGLHEAIDIAAPRGTPVRAVADGRIAKLYTSVPGGLTVYQFSQDETLVYYYAHLDGYASGLAEGQWLRAGDLVGTVGSTGNASADAPHLHFAVMALGPERRWWEGTPVNPYPLLGGQP